MKRLNLRRLADSCAILAEHDLLLQHVNDDLCLVAMLLKVGEYAEVFVGHFPRFLAIEAIRGVRHSQHRKFRSFLATRHDNGRKPWHDVRLTLQRGRDRFCRVLRAELPWVIQILGVYGIDAPHKGLELFHPIAFTVLSLVE